MSAHLNKEFYWNSSLAKYTIFIKAVISNPTHTNLNQVS